MNSAWGGHGIIVRKDIHIGIATAVEEGLLMPVVRHADREGLTQLAKEVADLAERARSKRLSPEEERVAESGAGYDKSIYSLCHSLRTPSSRWS